MFNKRCVLLSFSVLLIALFVLNSCNSLIAHQKKQELNYYSNPNVFERISGQICFINDNAEERSLYIGFYDVPEGYSDNTFVFQGKNYDLIINNGVKSKLNLEARIEIVTSPEYFGDGYVMPIVALSIDGDELLDFQTGYDNFIEGLKT